LPLRSLPDNRGAVENSGQLQTQMAITVLLTHPKDWPWAIKKPTWQNTRRSSTTSVYSLTIRPDESRLIFNKSSEAST
jgi:hypothetical protein